MHAAVFTILTMVGGADPAYDRAAPPEMTSDFAYASQCDQCVDGQAGLHGHGHRGWLKDWFGPMPQTCYEPRFGCYAGSPRTIHRYPAFHGYYYRHPYNYRHYFEYPWHAAPHEPMGYFTYETSQEAMPAALPSGGASPFVLER